MRLTVQALTVAGRLQLEGQAALADFTVNPIAARVSPRPWPMFFPNAVSGLTNQLVTRSSGVAWL